MNSFTRVRPHSLCIGRETNATNGFSASQSGCIIRCALAFTDSSQLGWLEEKYAERLEDMAGYTVFGSSSWMWITVSSEKTISSATPEIWFKVHVNSMLDGEEKRAYSLLVLSVLGRGFLTTVFSVYIFSVYSALPRLRVISTVEPSSLYFASSLRTAVKVPPRRIGRP